MSSLSISWRQEAVEACVGDPANMYWDKAWFADPVETDDYGVHVVGDPLSAVVIRYAGTAVYAVAPKNSLEPREDMYQTDDLGAAKAMALTVHRLGLYDHLKD